MVKVAKIRSEMQLNVALHDLNIALHKSCKETTEDLNPVNKIKNKHLQKYFFSSPIDC